METEEFIEKGKTIRGFEFLRVAVFRDAQRPAPRRRWFWPKNWVLTLK